METVEAKHFSIDTYTISERLKLISTNIMTRANTSKREFSEHTAPSHGWDKKIDTVLNDKTFEKEQDLNAFGPIGGRGSSPAPI